MTAPAGLRRDEGVTSDGMLGAALFGTWDGADRWRYRLERAWQPQLDTAPRRMTVIGCNPSTAGATTSDQTVRRCVHFAQREGCTSLLMLNLCALISTDPAALITDPDPVGPGNDEHITAALDELFAGGQLVVAAWGAIPRPVRYRAAAVRQMLARSGHITWCLGTTGSGSPRHPCRLGNDVPLTRWGCST